MSELEGFEARFAAAYRRYLDEAPTEVDPVEVARAVATQSRRRGIAIEWPSSLRLAPALAWLVLTALLVAALGAALIVGSHRPALGFSCPAGTNSDAPGPVAQARPPITFAGPPMAFDRRAGKVVAVVTDPSWFGTAQTWTFDVCSNTWTRLYPEQEPYGTSRLVYDADSDVTIAVDDTGGTWAYDFVANAWTMKARSPVPSLFASRPGLVYDSASGLVVARVQTSEVEAQLWTYDVDSDTWARVLETRGLGAADPPPDALLAYDASVDRLVAYGTREPVATWLFDFRALTWSQSRATTARVVFGYGVSGGEIAYDEAIRRTLVFARGRVIAYDAGADRWEVLAEGGDPDHFGGLAGPTVLAYPSTVYDVVNRRLVVNGGQYWTGEANAEGVSWAQSDDVLAFDPATHAWTTVLAAKTVQPI